MGVCLSTSTPLWKRKPRDLSGKVIAITGTTSGLGFCIAEAAVKSGCTKLFCLNRPSERAVSSLEKLKSVHPGTGPSDAQIIHVDCDLADFESVRAAAAAVKVQLEEESDFLDAILLNGGIMMHRDTRTKDGYDVQMQINQLSHFLLTKELFSVMRRSGDGKMKSRIVMHTSQGSQIGKWGLLAPGPRCTTGKE